MRVLAISSDMKAFEKGSAVRSRFLDYGALVEDLHILVFAKEKFGFHEEHISPNIFLHPTNSFCKLSYLWAAFCVARKLQKSGIHIDVVTTQDPFEAGIVGFMLARMFGARLHIQVHTDFLSPYYAKESFVNHARKNLGVWVLQRAHAVRVVSLRIKNSLSQILLTGLPVAVLPIYVERTPTSDSVDATYLAKKYPQFQKHILMASRLTIEKNISLALRVMVRIQEKFPEAGLIIVGSGPEEKRLRREVVRLGLSQKVCFEPWSNDLAPYYRSADVFVLTSNYEGYAMTAVEALFAGCPVAMTDVGCAGEVIISGEHGFVVPVGDSDALAEAVSRILSGGVVFAHGYPEMPSKETYGIAYLKSWEDALAK